MLGDNINAQPHIVANVVQIPAAKFQNFVESFPEEWRPFQQYSNSHGFKKPYSIYVLTFGCSHMFSNVLLKYYILLL